MSNGPIGRVAATQAQQGGTYSDAINRQLDLIERQRAVNLQNRLAREEKNREFRTEQLQNIYDFDVTALPPGYAAEIKKAQDQMASWLDPNSEVRYENKQQLISDISRLNNYYLAGKNQRLTSNEARTNYDNALIGGTSVAGAVMVGNETTRDNRQAAADAGGFGAYSVGGAPGSLSITGIQMQEGENGQYTFDSEAGQRIDILDSNFADGSGFFRLDLVAAAPYLSTATEGALTDERLDGTNSLAVAQIDYDVMNDAQKTRLQKEVYEEKTAGDKNAKPFEEWVKTADQAAIERLGLDEASLVKAIAASYDTGLEARPTPPGASAFDFNRSIDTLPQLSEPIKIRSTTGSVSEGGFAGTVEGAQFQEGLDLDELQKDPVTGAPLIPIEVAYVSGDGTIERKVIDPTANRAEYDFFMEAIGRRGREELLAFSGYGEDAQTIINVGGGTANAEDGSGGEASRQAGEDLGATVGEMSTPEGQASIRADLEVERARLDDEIEDAERAYILAQSLNNPMDQAEKLQILDDLISQRDQINADLEAMGGVTNTDADPAQGDPATAGTADAESRPLQTEPGGVYTSAQLEQNLESWEKELLAGTRPGQTVKSGVAVKAKNFGNLRPNTANPYRSGVYEVSPAEYDADGNLVKPANQYQNFATYDDGLKGLIWDIKSKQHLDGLSSSQVADGAEIIEVMKKYAPAADRNNPEGYTNHIVNFVNERLGLTGEEAFTSKSPASDLPTELLVEAIISKEDISLYKDMKERGYFEEDKISGIAEDINSQTARERRREISRA